MTMKRSGRLLGIPYDLRRPTAARLRARMFNTDDPRFLQPKVFGWGYDVNLGAPVCRLRRRRARTHSA